jgi:hypothetical protein
MAASERAMISSAGIGWAGAAVPGLGAREAKTASNRQRARKRGRREDENMRINTPINESK